MRETPSEARGDVSNVGADASDVRRCGRLGVAALPIALALAALAGLCFAWSGSAAAAHAASAHGARSRAVGAHGAAVQSVTDKASLHLTTADGNTLYEQGRAAGNLPGTVEVAMTLGDRTATSTFTIHTTGGTIAGRGSGKLSPGRAGYDSFGGTCAVTHGSGRFRGVSGQCGLYGSIYRVDDSMRIQVTGKLRY
jgi:hypothetical protein